MATTSNKKENFGSLSEIYPTIEEENFFSSSADLDRTFQDWIWHRNRSDRQLINIGLRYPQLQANVLKILLYRDSQRKLRKQIKNLRKNLEYVNHKVYSEEAEFTGKLRSQK